LNWQGGSTYATTVNTYNVRDQVTQVRQYAGAETSGTYQDTTMTYDGYGRLKTKHVPEQDAGTATTWVYNTDHTIQSITDARGASTTLTYNNGRHLPNVVTHALAGSSTIVESFSYDAAGNRTSMSDSSGGTTYQYNQLSQMTAETRTFAGLGGSYALAYEYHVGGQLKSLTDHTNQRINYAYDSAGRFNALTGTNYTYGQFINNVSYRAWGGPRQLSYGTGRTESVTYNARLKTNHYEMPAAGGFGAAVSIDYQYYDDGRLKYSHDLLDNRFDRSYEYDHVARLTKAFSGAEARGEPATNDRPYKETATYDAFNHLNVRSSKHWSKLMGFGSSDTYVNNRRVGWTYDAGGNWLSGAGRQKTYDAAGRPSNTSWTGGYFNEFLDGDGWRVKATEPNQVTYYLRSTVLGGQVVEELNSSGAKQQSFIYIGQKVVGHDWANGNVSLRHEDPAGVTVRSSLPQAAFVSYFAELDPWGAEVFSWDPYLDDPEFSGGRGESGPVYSGFGDIGMPSTGCMLDGVYALCDFISRGMNSGALALQLTQGGKTKQFPIAPGLLGMYAVWVEDAGKKLNRPQTPIGAQVSEDDVIATNTDDDGLGHWELISFAPQNTASGATLGKRVPCPTGENLLGNSIVQKALDQAFVDSKSGTIQEHEEGGYIWANKNRDIKITRVDPGPFAVGINGPMHINILRDQVPNAPDGFALVGYFHTHPYYEGQPVNGMNDIYNAPSLPSGADQLTAYDLGVPGLIAYRDKTGQRRNVSYGPDRNTYCY
jgi:YD repeat-containing protein